MISFLVLAITSIMILGNIRFTHIVKSNKILFTGMLGIELRIVPLIVVTINLIKKIIFIIG